MNDMLIGLLAANMGNTLTPEFAADICVAAECPDRLVPMENIELVRPEECEGFVFSLERIEDIEEEIRALHRV